MNAHALPKPVGGDLFGRTMNVLLGIIGISLAVIAYRFVAGIGAVTNMNDGYTWGIWEPVNVVVFTGLGAGAYSVGLLCYLLNRGEYHPLVRPAVLLGAIAYTLGGASIVVALGQPLNIYLLFNPGLWNLSSVLLEVAVCVTVYVGVLWIEMLPAALDRAAARKTGRRASFALKWGPRLAKAMPFIIALAMLLPTMHQSSLGGLMLIAGTKLHGLWHTPLLPLLALISCLSMGLGAVVVLTSLMSHTWKARQDQALLADMSRVNAGLLGLWIVVRVGDLALSGKLSLLGDLDLFTAVFAVEMGLFLIPVVLFATPLVKRGGVRVAGALLALAAATLWRVDTFVTCYRPVEGAGLYLPSLMEVTVTVGMAAIGMAIFIVISKFLPVVVVEEKAVAAPAEAPIAEAQPALALAAAAAAAPASAKSHPGTAVPASLAAFVLASPQDEKRPAPSAAAQAEAPAAPAAVSAAPASQELNPK